MASHYKLTESDLKLMLAAKVHVGTTNVDPNVERYCWTRKLNGGVYILNLGKTWEKLILAARIIAAIENPADVVVVAAKPYGQRAVFKFAQVTGASYIGGRYTPGTFTNQIQKKFMEPRLLIVSDPLTDHQPVKEASYVNIPCIAFCNTDSPLRNVDVAIPANNKHKFSVALMFWMLAREVIKMKNTKPLDVMVDLFMYREQEAEKKDTDDKNVDETNREEPSGDNDDTNREDAGDQKDGWGDQQATQSTPWDSSTPFASGGKF